MNFIVDADTIFDFFKGCFTALFFVFSFLLFGCLKSKNENLNQNRLLSKLDGEQTKFEKEKQIIKP